MRKGVSLLEILISVIVLGILLASISMATSAIYKSGQNMPGIVSLSKVASTLEHVFQRNLRGVANRFWVYNDAGVEQRIGQPGSRVDFLFSRPDGQRIARFAFEGDTLYYDHNVNDPGRERVASDILSVEFMRVDSDSGDQASREAVRLGIDIQLASGERIVTTVTGRQETQAETVVD